MKKNRIILTVVVLTLLSACSNPDSKGPERPAADTFNLVYVNGMPIPFGGSGGKKIYAIWAETTQGEFIRNIWVCKNSIRLPERRMPSYWYANIKDKAPSDEIDAVTGATHQVHGDKNIDFTLENISLPDPSIRSFYVCFEIDRSFDTNDWFSGSCDQPAILYKALVDFDRPESEFTLTPAGWTAGPMNDIRETGFIPDFALGRLNTDMRYITHLKNPDHSMGPVNPDPAFSALSMVGRITVKVNRNKRP